MKILIFCNIIEVVGISISNPWQQLETVSGWIALLKCLCTAGIPIVLATLALILGLHASKTGFLVGAAAGVRRLYSVFSNKHPTSRRSLVRRGC